MRWWKRSSSRWSLRSWFFICLFTSFMSCTDTRYLWSWCSKTACFSLKNGFLEGKCVVCRTNSHKTGCQALECFVRSLIPQNSARKWRQHAVKVRQRTKDIKSDLYEPHRDQLWIGGSLFGSQSAPLTTIFAVCLNAWISTGTESQKTSTKFALKAFRFSKI